MENKVLEFDGIKDAIIVSGADKEHIGYEVPYLFVVRESNKNKGDVLCGLKAHIKDTVAPEEQPKDIFVIDKKPVSRFKTDRKSLQKEYNLI